MRTMIVRMLRRDLFIFCAIRRRYALNIIKIHYSCTNPKRPPRKTNSKFQISRILMGSIDFPALSVVFLYFLSLSFISSFVSASIGERRTKEFETRWKRERSTYRFGRKNQTRCFFFSLYTFSLSLYTFPLSLSLFPSFSEERDGRMTVEI